MKRKTIMMAMALCLFLGGCGADTDTGVTPSATPTAESTVSVPEETVTDSETASGEEALKVEPLPSSLDVSNLQDATVSVSFDASGIHKDADGTTLELTVYDYETFDMVDMSQLKSGDTIVIDGKDVVVDSLERSDTGMISINGGLEEGGYDFWTDEDGVYYVTGLDDTKDFKSLGTVTLPVSENCVCTDDSDLDNAGRQFALDDVESLTESGYGFIANNTTVTVAGGEITENPRSLYVCESSRFLSRKRLLLFYLFCFIHVYSLRSATTGSFFAALLDGMIPAIRVSSILIRIRMAATTGGR